MVALGRALRAVVDEPIRTGAAREIEVERASSDVLAGALGEGAGGWRILVESVEPLPAAYATDLAYAHPKWGAARLKRERFNLAREATTRHRMGVNDAYSTRLSKPRTVRVVRPYCAPTTWVRAQRFN